MGDEDSRTDPELLEGWRAGDERAGRELFARHFDSIYRFFRSKVDDAAEDLTQQTFLGCVKGKERYRGDASFRTYLYTIARNRLYTYIRDRQRRDAVVSDIGQQSVVDLDLASPTQQIAEREEHKLLLRAMRHLSLDMQVALELHYWEGLSVREIAVVIETPEGTIKRRLQRARQRLDELIAELAQSDALRHSTQANFDDWAQGLRAKLNPRGD